MKEDSLKHGAFSWMELMTTDVKSAKEFYVKLFGWETEEYPMEGMDYTVIKINGDDTGGIMAMPPEIEGMPPMWGIYVTVDDVDSTAKKVEELGGILVMPELCAQCASSCPELLLREGMTNAGVEL